MTNSQSYLSITLRYYLDQPTLLEFIVGSSKGMGAIKDKIEECEPDMSFKNLSTKIITPYQPCLSLSLLID